MIEYPTILRETVQHAAGAAHAAVVACRRHGLQEVPDDRLRMLAQLAVSDFPEARGGARELYVHTFETAFRGQLPRCAVPRVAAAPAQPTRAAAPAATPVSKPATRPTSQQPAQPPARPLPPRSVPRPALPPAALTDPYADVAARAARWARSQNTRDATRQARQEETRRPSRLQTGIFAPLQLSCFVGFGRRKEDL